MQAASATAQILEEPHVNVSFSLQGRQLPADHGYLLYSAISRITSNASAPWYAGVPPARSPLHKTDWLAIELISGFPAGHGSITLPEHGATLRLRIPADHYRDVLPLAGKRLDIGGHQIRLGLPVARPLEPASSLYARVVTIKKFTEAEPFLESVKRKLDALGVNGRVELPRDEQGRYRRRIVTIHGKSVVGFSVAVHDLNDEDSLLLQAGAVKVVSSEDGSVKWQSIFSRRAMGCGIFNPPSEQSRMKVREKSLSTGENFMAENESSDSPIISIVFPAYGRRLPADHGYALYAAIARSAPALHRVPWLSIELISGVPWRDGIIVLPINGSRLHLRIPAERYADILPLSGTSLDINGQAIRLGSPTARPLQPTASLYARIVTIKKFTEAEPLLDAARRQIEALGINATLELPIDEKGRFRRRIIRIHDKAVVGFSLAAHGLSDEHSLRLQSHGVGGRRAMGCGVFIPITRGWQRMTTKLRSN